MIATLTFNLPEDDKDFIRASRALDLALVLWDFDQYLRTQVRYTEPDNRDDTEDIRQKLREVMEEHSIDLDSLLE